MIGLFGGFVLALIVPEGVLKLLHPLPTLGTNAQAYLLMLEAATKGDFGQEKAMCDEAYSMTTDSELRYLAKLLFRRLYSLPKRWCSKAGRPGIT